MNPSETNSSSDHDIIPEGAAHKQRVDRVLDQSLYLDGPGNPGDPGADPQSKAGTGAVDRGPGQINLGDGGAASADKAGDPLGQATGEAIGETIVDLIEAWADQDFSKLDGKSPRDAKKTFGRAVGRILDRRFPQAGEYEDWLTVLIAGTACLSKPLLKILQRRKDLADVQ